MFDNQEVLCPFEGGVVALKDDLAGNVTCPHTHEFCRTMGDRQCKSGCSRKGSCVNGECACDIGYQGDECDVPLGKDLEKDCVWPVNGPNCAIRQTGCYFYCRSEIFKALSVSFC